MRNADYKRLEEIIGRAYTLAAQVLNGEVPEGTLAEEISGECSELLALMNCDMGAFGQPELIDPELLALASALQPKQKE
jgi:hypothetical protein